MAIKCYLLTTEKKRNSTAIVDHTKSTWVYDCETVEPFSVTHPTVKFWFGANPATGESYNPANGINYAYIPEFARYYWINSWTYDSGMWYADMTVDALATYRTAIGETTAFVERGSKQNSALSDGLYPTAVNPEYHYYNMTTTAAMALGFGSSLGCYIVGIVNSDSNSVGCTSYYMFKNDGFRAFCNKLLGNIDWASAGIDEVSAPLLKALFNPMQYITSCIWLPYCPYEANDFTQISLPFGWWSFQATAKKLTVFSAQILYKGTIPKHPLAGSWGTYLNYAPYTRATLHWGPLGDMPLDTSVFGPNDNEIRLRISIDFVTGTALYYLSCYSTGFTPQYRIFQTGSVQIGVNVSVAQSTFNVFDTARSMVAIGNGAANVALGSAKIGATAGIAALTGGADQVVSGTTTIANGVIDGLQSIMPQISTSGANGCAIAFEDAPYISVQYLSPTNIAPELNGYLDMRRHVINTLSGYIKCVNSRYNGPGLTDEVATIEAAMANGFFYD